MSQSVYFAVFIGLVLVCVFGVFMWQTPKRRCPACDRETPMQKQRCLYCQYVFPKA